MQENIMLKRTMLIAACLLSGAALSALLTGASAQQPAVPSPTQQPPQPDNQGPSMGEKTGVDSMLNVTPSTQEFIKDAATSDLFEIASSRLAIERGDAKIKDFANQMLTDHQKTSSELKSMLQSQKIGATPPADLDSAHQSKIDKLKTLKGGDFDKRYREDQIQAHKTAVSLFERYSKSGDNPALKEWAATTLPALQHHLQMAQSLPH
jgi:putative membrane protein